LNSRAEWVEGWARGGQWGAQGYEAHEVVK
jgi:hypothetical protein